MRISDWSSDVCSSDLRPRGGVHNCEMIAPAFRKPGVLHGAGDEIAAIDLVADLQPVDLGKALHDGSREQLGRAWCRERVGQYVQISVGAVTFTKKPTSEHRHTQAQPPNTR